MAGVEEGGSIYAIIIQFNRYGLTTVPNFLFFFIKIWLMSDVKNVQPNYNQASFTSVLPLLRVRDLTPQMQHHFPDVGVSDKRIVLSLAPEAIDTSSNGLRKLNTASFDILLHIGACMRHALVAAHVSQNDDDESIAQIEERRRKVHRGAVTLSLSNILSDPVA